MLSSSLHGLSPAPCLSLMEVHSKRIPGQSETKLRHDAPDFTTVIAAVDDEMGEHLLARHVPFIPIGK